jgi:hypothetical protein
MKKSFLLIAMPIMIICFFIGCCNDNSQCPSGSYCEKNVGGCNSIGSCTEKPQLCPDLFIPEYVCGCDGETYDSACEAAFAGVNIVSEGECPCFNNSDCTPAEYCEKNLADCEGEGMCFVKPDLCTQIFDPVCGCDGNTYSNGCLAAQAGVSVASEGEC